MTDSPLADAYVGLPSQSRYDYSPITERPGYDWPGGRRLAVYFAINVEHFAFGNGMGPSFSPETSNDGIQRSYAWRDYGVRVGG